MPVDEHSVLPLLDEAGNPAIFRHDDWNSTAESLSCGEEEAFSFAVAEQDVTAFETVTIAEGAEIERSHIKTIGHAEFPRQLVNFLHRFALHPQGVIESGGFRTGPCPHDNVWIFRQEIRQGHQAFVLKRTTHPSNYETTFGIELPFRHAKLGHWRGKNPACSVAILTNPIAVAVHHLLGNTRHRHATATFVSFVEIAPSGIVPGMQHEGGRPLRQSFEVSIA